MSLSWGDLKNAFEEVHPPAAAELVSDGEISHLS